MSEFNFKMVEKLIKAVANRRRLQILFIIKKEKEATVGLISQEIKLSFKSTSKHLGVLFSANIIEKEQRGLEVYYSLAIFQHSVIKHILSIL